MKKITLISFALVWASSAMAVITKDCPKTLVVELDQFELNYVIDDNFEPQDLNDFPYDGYNGPGMLQLRKELKDLGSISAEVELMYTASSQCSYRGKDIPGKFVGVNLKGSLRPNAKEPATMILYRGSLAAYIPLKSLKPIQAKKPTASLYYRGEYCSWGDCIPNHIKIGDAKSVLFK